MSERKLVVCGPCRCTQWEVRTELSTGTVYLSCYRCGSAPMAPLVRAPASPAPSEEPVAFLPGGVQTWRAPTGETVIASTATGQAVTIPPAPSEEAPALCRSCRNPGCMGDVDAADRARCKTLAGAPSSEAGTRGACDPECVLTGPHIACARPRREGGET